MKWPEKGEPVAIVQQALLDLGFSLPFTNKSGSPDGIFGGETLKAVQAFQKKYGLIQDGVVGKQTMAKLDSLLPGKADPKPFSSIPYQVPGIKTVLAQPSPMSCWATVYCMMRSWKDQTSYPIREAVLKVGTKWANYYDKSFAQTTVAPIHGAPPIHGTGSAPIHGGTLIHGVPPIHGVGNSPIHVANPTHGAPPIHGAGNPPIHGVILSPGTPPSQPTGLPPNEFAPFLEDAKMAHQPMINLPMEQWAILLRTHGLLWIGASVTIHPNTGLHSRILEGMTGDGNPGSTFMKIIDPDGGKQYLEPFLVFLAKYEAGILSVGGEYFQIRHFR